jgi:mono/diheme cytochrome c family protein
MPRVAQPCAALLLSICMASERAEPAQPVLTITAGVDTKHFTVGELLSRADLTRLEIPPNVDYKFSLTVKAVPLLDLLAAIPLEGFDRLEASATDGFVAQIPLALIEAGKSGGSVAWIAVEDPNHPWPKLPGKNASAGPFYLVWQYPGRSRVSSEQWPYMLERLTAVQSPELRWPQLKVDAALTEDPPARRGEEVFVTQCLPCHRLNGGGASDIGPDLGQPMAATDYLTEAGIRALVRDPKSVRTWPQQQMPAFPLTVLADTDLNALIAYLRQIASQRGR